MKSINLRKHYPFYELDCFFEVPDDVAESLQLFNRLEHSYLERRRRYKAYYSLDCEDNIEQFILFVSPSPEELYEDQLIRQELYKAISSLPDKQAKRVYAHFFLEMSKAAIARAEGVDISTVRNSITRGIRNIKNTLKKYSGDTPISSKKSAD